MVTTERPGSRKNLIIDTDIFGDCDDAGALLIAATSPHVNLLGVLVNHPSRYSCLTVSAILSHYGKSNVPIAALRPLNDELYVSKYGQAEFTSRIAKEFPGGSLIQGHEEDALEPVALYRRLLSQAEDKSVVIASIGFFENLVGLLKSTPDEYSELHGDQLVIKKVSELAVMGGWFPSGREFNFFENPAATAYVVDNWPTMMTFLGFEVGLSVLTAGPLMATEGLESDPVRKSYIYFNHAQPRQSWDPLTIYYVIYGLDDLFEYNTDTGFCQVLPDGANKWVVDATKTNQRYLKLKVDNATAEARIDQLLLDGAMQFRK